MKLGNPEGKTRQECMELIREHWRSTEIGAAEEPVSLPWIAEVEYYYGNIILAISLRLDNIQQQTRKGDIQQIQAATATEKEQIQKELTLCSQMFGLLFAEVRKTEPNSANAPSSI